MKQVITLILTMITIGVFACFFSDPHDTLPTRTLLTSDDRVQVELPNTERPDNFPAWTKPQAWPATDMEYPRIDAYISFPFTVQVEFTGFEDNSVPTRVCLLYYNKSGKWTIIKDMRPVGNITSNTGVKQAMFGRYVFKQNYGYKNGDIIPCIIYIESETSRTHNLQQLLNGTLKWDAEGVLYLGVIDNTRPR